MTDAATSRATGHIGTKPQTHPTAAPAPVAASTDTILNRASSTAEVRLTLGISRSGTKRFHTPLSAGSRG
jgi:hypothetical protein